MVAHVTLPLVAAKMSAKLPLWPSEVKHNWMGDSDASVKSSAQLRYWSGNRCFCRRLGLLMVSAILNSCQTNSFGMGINRQEMTATKSSPLQAREAYRRGRFRTGHKKGLSLPPSTCRFGHQAQLSTVIKLLMRHG